MDLVKNKLLTKENMNKGNLKKKLYAGEVCLGTWVFIPCPAMVEIIGLSNFDFIIIDMEHAPISYESSIDMITAAENRDLTPLVRVSSLNSSSILRALDSGAHGIQVPHISTVDDALKCIDFAKYFPIGSRGMAPNARAGNYTYDNAHLIAERENDNLLTVLNVEGKEGVKNLADILKIKEIDVIFIGPYDLSQSCGYPGQIDHPEVLDLIKKSVDLIKEAGKVPGCFARDLSRANQLIDLGVQYLTFSADGPIMRSGFESIRNGIQ